MNKRNLIAIDLAKNVLQVGIKDTAKQQILTNKKIRFDQLATFLARQPPSLVVMEACSTAHYWSWIAESHGHEVKMLPPVHVTPFRQGHKTDANDVLALMSAAEQPHLKHAVKKSVEQLSLQTFLGVRGYYVDEKRALSNRIRGLLLEFGVRIPKGYAALKHHIHDVLEDAENYLPDLCRELIWDLYQDFERYEQKMRDLDRQLRQIVKTNNPCHRLTALEGIGDVCSMSLYVKVGDGSAFKNGREAAALIGATPQQHSTGGKANIGHIRKKHVDKQLRALLLQGAKAVIYKKTISPTQKERWLRDLVARRGEGIAAVALLNKNIRTAWAMLKTGEEYRAV